MTSVMPATLTDLAPVVADFPSFAYSPDGSISPADSFIASFPLHTSVPVLNLNEMDPKLVPKVRKSGGGNKKGTSAERRATHNAVERARRESLNVRFLELAACLPSMAGVRRPSKNLIVKKSLAFVSDALARETMYRGKILDIARENEALREELNALRQREGRPPVPPTADTSLPPPMSDVTVQRERQVSTTSLGHPGMGDEEFDEGSGGSDSGLAADSPYGGNQSSYTHGASAGPALSQFHNFIDQQAAIGARGGQPSGHGSYGSESAYSTYSNEDAGIGANTWPSGYGSTTAVPHSFCDATVPGGITAALGGGSLTGAAAFGDLPPITPTTAMIFNNVLASLEIPGEQSPTQHYEASPPLH